MAVFGGILLSLFLALPGFAIEPVVDSAGVLSETEERDLVSSVWKLRSETDRWLVVMTLPSLGSETIEQAAERIFRENQIGLAKADNGLLLLVAVAERRARLEVGYGLEGEIPDLLAQRILDEELNPSLRDGKYAEGFENVVARLSPSGARFGLRPTENELRLLGNATIRDRVILGLFFLFGLLVMRAFARLWIKLMPTFFLLIYPYSVFARRSGLARQFQREISLISLPSWLWIFPALIAIPLSLSPLPGTPWWVQLIFVSMILCMLGFMYTMFRLPFLFNAFMKPHLRALSPDEMKIAREEELKRAVLVRKMMPNKSGKGGGGGSSGGGSGSQSGSGRSGGGGASTSF